MRQICQKIAQMAQKPESFWNVTHIPIKVKAQCRMEEADLKRHLIDSDSPKAIFLFLPNVTKNASMIEDLELVYTCIQCILFVAAKKQIQLYCCSQETSEPSPCREGFTEFLRSAMSKSVNHRYRSISYDDRLVGEGQVALRMVQEWLCDGKSPMNAPMIRYAQSDRLELQVKETGEHDTLDQFIAFREGGTYLMVDPIDTEGEYLCLELGRQYHAQWVILSRSNENEVKERLAPIEKAGAFVTYRFVDFSDKPALEKEMESLREDGIVFHGVVHMAHWNSDVAILKKSSQEFSQAMSAKAQGALNVDAVTAKDPLDFFLICSSPAAFGANGSPKSVYFAGFQNAMVRYRNRLAGRPGRSLAMQWEMNGNGISSTVDAFENGEISERQFVNFLETLTDSDYTEPVRQKITCAIKRFDRKKARQFTVRPSKLPDEFRGEFEMAAATNGSARPKQNAPVVEERKKSTTERIKNSLSNVLKISKNTLDLDQPFQDYGLTSITAMQLATSLEKEFKLSIQPKWLVENPTLKELGDRLSQEINCERGS